MNGGLRNRTGGAIAMKRGIRIEKLKANALVAFELALQLAQDEEFRNRLSSALEHGKEVWRHARPGRGIAGTAKRLAADHALQAELKEVRRDLQQAYALADAKRRGARLRRITPFAALASLAAVPEVRQRFAALLETASSNRQHLKDIATAAIPGKNNGRPGTLEDLTKEELYARAQQAEIPGRSDMSKEELVAALRTKS
jgi:hypothetical protein